MSGGKAPRAAGDRFERACVVVLRAHGFLAVRSAGSLGPADIVALRADRRPALVQCKITDNTTAGYRAAFYLQAQDAGAVAVIASRPALRRGAVWVWVNEIGSRLPYGIEGPEWPN